MSPEPPLPQMSGEKSLRDKQDPAMFSFSPFLLFSSSSCLFLVGARGSGKSTVARLLAHELGWDWLDADAELEARYGQSIRAIFAAEGEAGFRDKESAVLAELCRLRRNIIATGGGVVLRESNRALLRASGRVVWLTADVETLWRRLQGDDSTVERRPALTIGGRAEVEEIIRLREPLYRQCADLIVDTTGRVPKEIAAEIVRRMDRSEPRP
ncbi:MAG: shikimate kinase [Gemmataceae bacterium]